MAMCMERGCGRIVRVLFGLIVAVSVAACASAPKKQPAPDYAALMSDAESQVAASNFSAALSTFESAARADPTRKEPWVRLAQLNFDVGNFGRAIVAAEEVLQRDPADKVAESVLTVGGFRVAAQSLRRLQEGGALTSGPAQIEARQLVNMIRDTMGTEVAGLGPDQQQAARPQRRRATAAPAPARKTPEAKPAQKSSNPFDKLGGN
ncbi:MAG: hypothetical protein QM599_06885 [Pseudoxanthomonas sp.]